MILVTGSAGFIGSNLCYHLVRDKKLEVLGVDKITPGISNRDWTLPLEEEGSMIFRKVDLLNLDSIINVFKEFTIDKIVHLAAESHVDRSISNPSQFWQSNVIGTNNLMHAALEYSKVDIVINQITDEAYGEKPIGEAFEGDKFNPTSPYPCSKVSQYWVGRSFYITYGLPIISTFPVNCYGPRQNAEKLIPKFITSLLNNSKVPLMESTHFQRDWLPVIDMCRAHSFLLEKGEQGEDYNVGANNHRSNRQVTETLLDILNKDWSSSVEIVPDRRAHDCRYSVNCNKLKKLGWNTTQKWKPYLTNVVEWYKEHEGIKVEI